MDFPDPLGEGAVLHRMPRWRPPLPGLISTPGHLQHPAQKRDRVVGLLRIDESVSTHRIPSSLAKKAPVGSTGRCNTIRFGCCPDRRCMSGESGSSWRVVGSRQEGVVGAVEGRGVHKRHRPGTTESLRLHPRDDRGHRRLLSARASQARMRAHPGFRCPPNRIKPTTTRVPQPSLYCVGLGFIVWCIHSKHW
jgi:hypothetical protein